MAKTRRRVLSILMALVLTLGLLPTAALAASGRDKSDPIVRFFVLDPNEGTPNNNNNGNKGSYYPKEGDDGGVDGATWKTGYPGGSLTPEGLQAFQSIGATGLFAANGINSAWYTEPHDLGDFCNEEIVWYSIKWQSSEGLHYCNIDGYVKDKTVNIFYYSNFNDQDKRYYRTSGETGESHTVLDYGDTMLLSRPGYEFTGWNTEKDGTGDSYNAAGTFTITGPTDLYAQWEEIQYTPSDAPTATLTLNKEWATNVATGSAVTINLNKDGTSIAPNEGSVTSGTSAKLTFDDLTPGATYQIIESPADYILLDESGNAITSITLGDTYLSSIDFEEIDEVENCSQLENDVPYSLQGANCIVAARTGSNGVVIWTYNSLSDTEKAKLLEELRGSGFSSNYQFAPGAGKDPVRFISGVNAQFPETGDPDVMITDARKITFSDKSVWSKFALGTYTYNYGGTENEVTVTNSAKTGTLTISKTFSYEGTTNTSAPAGFGATFVVKNKSGTPVASLTYAELSDSTKNPITNLPYGTYTVEETNITGTLAPAYNPTPTVSYDDGTDGTGKTDNQIALNAPTATMKVNNRYSLTNSPIVGITKDATASATVGDTITYTITVTNTGGGAAYNVEVTDTLPDGLVKENAADVTLDCPEGMNSSYDSQTGIVTWTISALAAQTGEVELTVQVKVADSALSLEKITNTAYMKTYDGYQGDPIPAHAETKITKSNLSIAKSASSSSDNTGATAKPGDTITYTITVTNSGDADAKGKTVIDTLPSAGLQDINPGNGNYDKDKNTITWKDLTIPAGQTVTLTVTATVAPLANTSQGITLVNNVAMDDLSDSVTTRVGATTATLTIEKYVTGLPAADTAAWNALVNAVSFTVTGQPESGEAFTPVTVDLDEFQSTVSGVYTYSLENLAPGTYTVTENGYDVLSTYGYTWNAENSVASVNNKTVTAGVPASAAIRNEYDSREFTIIFDSNTNGVLLNRDRSTVAMGDSFRYSWFVPTGNETVSTGPSWAGALVGETFNGSPNSQVSYTFTKAEYLEYGNHNTYSMAFSQPGVTANNGYSFTGSFTTTGTDTGVKFVDLETTMAALLESGQDQITYYANYSSSSGPIDPGPIDPGPIDPGPIDPGPSDPGTDIPDDNTPTTDLPEEETPTTELPDEETPMTEEPVEELPDEEVPMAEVPATGDTAGLWALAAGVSGLALVWLALSGKKRREENA